MSQGQSPAILATGHGATSLAIMVLAGLAKRNVRDFAHCAIDVVNPWQA